MIASAILLASLAHAADPWDRPEHLRAVSEPPARYSDLNTNKQRLRLWWDIEPGATYEVQALLRGRWKTLADDTTAGWVSRPLPLDTSLRVRRADVEDGRWSDPVSAPPWASPTDLARLAGPDGAILAGGVGQIAPAGSSAWVSLLGGGLAEARIDAATVRPFTRWEGLPDDEVVAVSARGEDVLVGTAAGAALLSGGVVQQVWDESLPDPYVQAVLIGSSALWIGSYRGLARVSPAGVEDVLTPWSVFSLSEEDSGDIWVGYEGFRRLSPVGDSLDAPVEETPEEGEELSQAQKLQRDLLTLKVYDTALAGASRWLATENFGLVLFADGDVNQVEGYPGADTYGVTVNAQGVWVAGSGEGLVGPRGIRLGRADGLPSGTVWSVAGVGSGLWVGTNRGLAWVMLDDYGAVRSVVPRPYSRWPADRYARDLVANPDGAFVAGKAGVWTVGAPRRHAENLVAAVDGPVVALLELDGTLWAVGDDMVGLDEDGRLSRIALPQPAVSAVVWNEVLWIADGRVLWRYDPERGRLVRVSALEGVTRLTSNQQAIWAVTERGRLARVLLGASRPIAGVDLVIDAQPGEDGTVCLGTEDGLVRLMEDSGQTQDVLGTRDQNVRVPAVAIDAAGGCWFAAEDGTVGRALLDGREAYTHLPDKSVGEPLKIVPDGEDAAWVLTSRGTWRIVLPL